MGRFLVLLVLALLTAAEVAAVLAMVDALGAGATLAILMLDVLAGIVVMRWAVRSPQSERGWRLAAGAVIALPGLVLDLAGLALLVPAVRAWLSRRVLEGTHAALNRRGMSVVTVTDPAGVRRTTVVPGDVIPGEVVDPGQEPAPGTATDRADASGQSGSGPSVVRGEIAGADE